MLKSRMRQSAPRPEPAVTITFDTGLVFLACRCHRQINQRPHDHGGTGVRPGGQLSLRDSRSVLNAVRWMNDDLLAIAEAIQNLGLQSILLPDIDPS